MAQKVDRRIGKTSVASTALVNSFEKQLSQSWPPKEWADVTVLVAVSGGADSVAMLRGLASIRADGPGKLIVGHFNHGLRGLASDGDEQFVASLCAALDLGCEFGRSESPLKDQPDGIESAARNARYEFLKAACKKHGARFVVTAHTYDDQAETILHRIVRGTGIAGLAGIPRTRELISEVTLIRPLLEFRRSEIITYLDSIGQDFREDATNNDCQFTRNRIRQELLPHLSETYNQSVVEALNRLGTMAGEVQCIIDKLVEDLCETNVTEMTDDSITIAVSNGQSEFLLCEMLKSIWKQRNWPLQRMAHEHWKGLAKLIVASSNDTVVNCPGNVRAEKKGSQVILTRPLK